MINVIGILLLSIYALLVLVTNLHPMFLALCLGGVTVFIFGMVYLFGDNGG